MTEDVKQQIEEIVNRETRAWDTQDVDLLMTVFHHDMVWPWPRTPQSHNPMDWVIEWGRYDYERWKRGWQELFDTHRLASNHREIKKIEISKEGDGAARPRRQHVVDARLVDGPDLSGEEGKARGLVRNRLEFFRFR